MFWPGAATGVGAPTDRPERIADHFVELGAPLIHLVDFDGARSGPPVNLEAVGRVASRIATPLQLAGGVEGADRIQLAFAAGATRVVLAMSVVEEPSSCANALAVAGDWLAVGLDPRPERFAAFPWRRPVPPSLRRTGRPSSSDQGVRRFVLAHGGADAGPRPLLRRPDRGPRHRPARGRRGARPRSGSAGCAMPGSGASSWARRSCPGRSTIPPRSRPPPDEPPPRWPLQPARRSGAASLPALALVAIVLAGCISSAGLPGAVAPASRAPAGTNCPTSQPATLPAGSTRTVTIATPKGTIVVA